VASRLTQRRPHRLRGAVQVATEITLDLLKLIGAPLGRTPASGRTRLAVLRRRVKPLERIPGRILSPDDPLVAMAASCTVIPTE
jgi:hypothetical protein